MARPPERFVSTLTNEEKSTLTHTWKHSPSHRERCRAHAILLSHDRWPVGDIALVFQVTAQTVCSWLDRWDSNQDLDDAHRSGAPTRLNPDEEQEALKELEKNPHNPQGVIDGIALKTGKQVTRDILRRLAKKLGYVWKRMRGSTRDRRNEQAFHAAKEDIIAFSHLAREPEINVWFFDEAAFSLTPSVPYAWQRIGETIELPFQRGTSYSAIGFVDLESNFYSYEFNGTVTSEVAMAVMDRFAEQVKGTNVVIIDNAPMHHSHAFADRIPIWKEHGVHLYFLPPYSPELNLIEMIWREIKHRWLPLRAYRSAKALWDELGQVLGTIGKDHKIHFPSLGFQ